MHQQFALRLLEETLHLEPRTLKGGEALADLEAWDSLATLAFIAMADKHFAVLVPGGRVARCQSVGDLLGLLGVAAADRVA
jgi:hypothetical protein